MIQVVAVMLDDEVEAPVKARPDRPSAIHEVEAADHPDGRAAVAGASFGLTKS